MNARFSVASTLTGYLDAVYADPRDDHARMDYALRAHEQGIPHGEFVMLQMLAKRRSLSAMEAAREAELLAKHRREWLGPLARVTRHVRFRRGFPADLLICAGRDAELKAIEGHAVYSTIESLELEHVHGGHCRRTGWSQVGLAHPIFRALRSLSGIYGAPILDACRAHRQLESLGWFVPPESTASMPPAPSPDVAARAVADLPALRCMRVGNDSVTTSDEIDDEIACILLSGHQRPERVGVVLDHRFRGWLRRMKKFSTGQLDLRSDGCGTMRHSGLTVTVQIACHVVRPRASAVFTSAPLQPGQYELRAFAAALPDLAREGVELVEVTLPDPTRDGPFLHRALSPVRRTSPEVAIRHTASSK